MDVTWFVCVSVVGWAIGVLTRRALNSRALSNLSATQRNLFMLGACILGLLGLLVAAWTAGVGS